MGLIGWIIFGALAGWAANVIIGGRERRAQGCLVNILVGVVGAVLGGLLYRLVTGHETNLEFDLPSFGIAVLGSVVLKWVNRTAAQTTQVNNLEAATLLEFRVEATVR
ncbi:MAG: GlsB/YeaQ/YmgE family stress response membrane protein [Pseudonocardiaceae bacterium]